MFDNRRILLTHKIATIGAIGVLGVLVLGAIYHVGSANQDRYRLTAEQRASDLCSRRMRCKFKLLQSTPRRKGFPVAKRHSNTPTRHTELDSTIRANIAQLRQQAEAAALPDLVRRIDFIGAGLVKYRTHFLALVEARQRLGLDEKSGLEGALRASVHAIEVKLNELKDPRLLVTMLMMRRHEKDFMLRRDARYGEDIKKRAAEMLAGLDAVGVAADVKDDIKRKLADYQRDFFAWMETALKVANEQKLTSDVYAEIEPAIEALLQAVAQSGRKRRPPIRSRAPHTKLQMQFAILLIAIIACGFAFWIGRLVSRPITGDDQGDGRPCGRELRGRACRTSNARTRLAQMARAVVVFRDSGLEKIAA